MVRPDRAKGEPAHGPDRILVESGRDNRDWLLVAHEGGHLLTPALLSPAMRERQRKEGGVAVSYAMRPIQTRSDCTTQSRNGYEALPSNRSVWATPGPPNIPAPDSR